MSYFNMNNEEQLLLQQILVLTILCHKTILYKKNNTLKTLKVVGHINNMLRTSHKKEDYEISQLLNDVLKNKVYVLDNQIK